MNLLYFTHYNLEDKNYYGVKKKIFSQYKVFNNHIKTGLIYFNKFNMCFINENEDRKTIITFRNKIEKRVYMYKYLHKIVEENNVKNLYIRYPYTDFYFVSILKKFKLKKIKIFLEIPTYPFEKEGKTSKDRILNLIDMIFNNKLKKYVDYVVTFSEHEEIFGIKTIKINNGIDVKNIPIRNFKKHEGLNLMGVANVSKWHGYDRIIKGLYEYYNNIPNEEIYFNIVGEGEELENLKRLTKSLNLEKFVIFHGFKKEKELDELFNIADIGIGSLGNHRKGLLKESALKSREYCARGLPFVISSEDSDFTNFKYALKVKNDDSPININEIIKFFNSVKGNDYINEMRVYAEKHLSWDVKMKPVIEKILEEKDENN
ncbi:hypothetical protein X275_00630 [Marinitoga sp. 1197]|uniref:glycosyltransferase n=1 Tax=Marinitoga sp. 1197 TaxID=1428449 RepID=UPI0006414463|nr:glycosyltransferase [Marinitoga sp. 1197]KLO24336.1 hypothetical protein X275_00630 [Marinitoga sp. 1197]